MDLKQQTTIAEARVLRSAFHAKLLQLRKLISAQNPEVRLFQLMVQYDWYAKRLREMDVAIARAELAAKLDLPVECLRRLPGERVEQIA